MEQTKWFGGKSVALGRGQFDDGIDGKTLTKEMCSLASLIGC
jgi:hypothetical protein